MQKTDPSNTNNGKCRQKNSLIPKVQKFLFILCIATSIAIFYPYFRDKKPDSQPSSPALETVKEWTYMQIFLSLPGEKEPFSLKIEKKLQQLKRDLSDVFSEKTIPPDYSQVVIDYSNLERPANFGAFCTMITRRDVSEILKKYGENPFYFRFEQKINEEKIIQMLIKEGYQPQEGVYDSLSPAGMIAGFSFPLKEAATGYAICVENGEIIQIRKLRNYNHYLEAREKKTDYTAMDITYLYLPEFGKKDSPPVATHGSSFAIGKWSPEQIAYTYVSKNWKNPSETIEAHKAILKKSFQEAYLELAEAKDNYLSVSREDMKSIVETYGENPFRLRFKDNIDEVAIFQKLEKAGYQPRILNENLGFSFPLKNDSGGYAVYIDNGRISQIRELWNYAEFLESEKTPYNQKEDRGSGRNDRYTANGVLLLYLPDLEKKD